MPIALMEGSLTRARVGIDLFLLSNLVIKVPNERDCAWRNHPTTRPKGMGNLLSYLENWADIHALLTAMVIAVNANLTRSARTKGGAH